MSAAAEAPFATGRLREFLAAHGCAPRGPLTVRQFAHGHSNPTYLLEGAATRLVLRAKPPGRLLPSAHAVDREFRVMQALRPTAVPVPQVVAYCEDESVIGAAFYVMEFVAGRIFQDIGLAENSPAERAAIYAELNRVIARLHALDPAAIGLDSFGKPHGYVRRQIERWTRQYRASETHRIEAMERLIEWLPAHLPPEQPARIAHGDYRLDNVIFHPREPRIAAVIDWELATLGDPLADFAYHCMPWRLAPDLAGTVMHGDVGAPGIPPLQDYLQWYEQHTGCAAGRHFDYYMAFGMFRLAAILQGVAARALQGNASNARAAEAGRRAAPLAEAAWEQACLAARTVR